MIMGTRQMLAILMLFMTTFSAFSMSLPSDEEIPSVLSSSSYVVDAAELSKTRCRMNTTAYPPDLSRNLPTGEPRGVEWHVVDLDMPAKDRWTHIVQPVASEIKALTDVVLNTLRHLLGDHIVDFILSHFRKEMNTLTKRLPLELGDEILGVASATGIDTPIIFLYNIFYTVFGACTSMVAQDTDGEIYFGRNLDFGLWPAFNMSHNSVWQLADRLRPIVINVDFQRQNKTVFKSTTFAGFVGVTTAMKPNKFALSIDTRFDSHMDAGLFEWFMKSSDTDQDETWACRRVMEEAESFADAADDLNRTNTMGPGYIILGGTQPGEGVIITKGAPGLFKHDGQTIDYWRLDERIAKNDTYFLLMTNYDRTKSSDPFYDNRRGPADLCMRQIAPRYNMSAMFDVLSGKPNLNRLTTFTTVMHPKSGEYEAYRQFCEDKDCPLF